MYGTKPNTITEALREYYMFSIENRPISWGGHMSPIFAKVYLTRKPGGQILYKSINNTGKSNFTLLNTKEESQVFNLCRQQIGDLVYDHVSTMWIDGVLTVCLYRDEIMNDDLISKLQDELYPRNCNVKVIYNWESN